MSPAQNVHTPLSYQTLIAGGSLILVMAGAGWTLFQTQFTQLDKTIENVRWEVQRRETELKANIATIDTLIDSLRPLYLTRTEHASIEKRIDERLSLIQQQLLQLERTRPTTGELQTTNDAIAKRIEVLTMRLNNIEARTMK